MNCMGLRQVSLKWCRQLSSLPARAVTVAKFDFPLATHSTKQVDREMDRLISDGLPVTLNGHLHKKPRMMTTKGFAELRDGDGQVVQIVADPQGGEWLVQEMAQGGAEDSVSVTGTIRRKMERKGGGAPTSNGKGSGNISRSWELYLTNYQTLNSSNLSAARLDKLKHSSPQDLPPEFRYLQLRTEFYQNALRTRSRVSTLIRNTLIDNHDFIEIETPLLFKSTPEGAREFLVPTRTAGKFYALPQSPQQYKQILMSSGFTRYFQLAKCFRDEDLRADRQPEFTQVDLEMSYVSNSDQVALVVEDIVQNVWNKVGNLPTYRINEEDHLEVANKDSGDLQFTKLKYEEALVNYGIDKPDLRSSLKFIDLSKFFTSSKNPEFPIVEACVLKGAFDPATKYKVPHLLTDAINYTRRKPIVLTIKTEKDVVNWYEKFVEKGVLIVNEGLFDSSALHQALSLAPGDILAFSTRAQLPYENPTPLGKFRQQAISEFPEKWNRPIQNGTELVTDYDREKVFVGAWVVDFPLFNPVDISEPGDEFPRYDRAQFESTHHPFTMAKTEDYDLLATDPLKVRGEHYDLVINGVEVGGGSRRIHDPQLQQYVFENILKVENYEAKFGHLLEALSMGCPPHAGLALGFDRLCAMLIGSSSVRDVIAFPKNQSGVDPVVESPTGVSEKTLRDYHIMHRSN